MKSFVCSLIENKLEKRSYSHLIFIPLATVLPYLKCVQIASATQYP